MTAQENLAMCPNCEHADEIAFFEVSGGCEGYIFCPECACEFDPISGKEHTGCCWCICSEHEDLWERENRLLKEGCSTADDRNLVNHRGKYSKIPYSPERMLNHVR